MSFRLPDIIRAELVFMSDYDLAVFLEALPLLLYDLSYSELKLGRRA